MSHLQEVGAQKSIAIHHGTFNLTDEAMDEPRALLPKKASAAGLQSDAFQAIQHGATLQIEK